MNEDQLEEIKGLFSKYGYHFTKQRSFICRELWESKKHYMTGSEIYEFLKNKNNDLCLATVYRAIDSLEKMGLLKKAIIEDRVIKYKICFDFEKNVHSHLICKNCGKIIQVKSENLTKLTSEIKSEYNFEIKNQIINFNGLCAECSKKKK